MTGEDLLKVVVAKPGLDGHDRGAKVIARGLRDAGMEVVYTGVFRTPAEIVATVLQEDAHVLGLSVLSGAHLEYVEEITRLLREQGVEDMLLIVGGTIPPKDVPRLREMGVAAVFGPGTRLPDIIKFINASVARSRHG